ncbi:hypothetical protein [Micromonospora haikouensis]|uniref:hypothetical protein n=1 Tax=Micromonospora haikouensis TaxID=686309 RepID=UPI003D71F828
MADGMTEAQNVMVIGSENAQVVRRHYVFALRDEVPAPDDGWTVYRHGPECFVDDSPSCEGEKCEAAEVCKIFLFEGEDGRLFDGFKDLLCTLGRLSGQPEQDSGSELNPLPVRRVVAAVGAPWREGDNGGAHYEKCMSLLRDTVNALRLATGAHTPQVTIERVWPAYFVVDEYSGGMMEAQQLAVVEHGWRPVPAATCDEVETAHGILIASWLRNPTEIYGHFRLEAQRAAQTDGDYVECILKAATAAEVLIKNVAWMLTWEATEIFSSDPAPGTFIVKPTSEGKPRDLIGKVLSPRLGGNWSSQTPRQPIGAWRTAIAKRRNAVIHLGYRPSAEEAYEAIAALTVLEKHVVDRLAAKSAVYPRTALQIIGRSGLEHRGAFGKVRATHQGQDLQELLKEYLSWVEGHLDLDL